MSEAARRGLLSIGAFLIVIVISILLYAPLGLISWDLILPLILALSGIWLMVLAGIKTSNPDQYDRGPFSTFSWGVLLLALGGAWFIYGYGLLYSIVLLLVVLAVLAIAAALKRK